MSSQYYFISSQRLDSKKDRFITQLFSIMMACVISLVSFFRGMSFDPDYKDYLRLFNEIGSPNHFFSGNMELGFQIVLWAGKSVGFDLDIILFLTVFFCLALKFYCVSKLGMRVLLCFIPLYVGSFFLIHEMIQVRLAIATSLLFVMFILLFELNRFKPRIYMIFLSFIFHYSALLLSLFSFIKKERHWIGLLVIAVFVLPIALNFITIDMLSIFLPEFIWGDDRIRGYSLLLLSSSEAKLNLFNSGNILYLLELIFIRFVVKFFLPRCRNRIISINEILVLSSFIFYFLFLNAPVIATRVAELLRIFMPLALALVFSKLLSKGRDGYYAFVTFSIGVNVIATVVLYGVAITPVNYVLQAVGLSRGL